MIYTLTKPPNYSLIRHYNSVSAFTSRFFPGFISIIFSVFLSISPIYNQSLAGFDRYSLEAGLSQNTVGCIQADRFGFLWVGTQNGLNRFNGYQFNILKHDPEDSTTLSSSYIKCIAEDSLGYLWVGTRNGLNKLDPASGKIERILHDNKLQPNLLNQQISALWIDHSDIIWIGTTNAGLYKLNSKTRRIQSFKHDPNASSSLSDNYINAIFRDTKGILWIASNGGLDKMNETLGQFDNIQEKANNSLASQSKPVYSLFEDYTGRIWAGKQSGLFYLDRETESLTLFQLKSNKLPSKTWINAITGDRSGNIWAGTYGHGLIQMNTKTGRINTFQKDPNNKKSLSHNLISSFYWDQAGDLWIGTNDGLNRLDDQIAHFRHFIHDPEKPTSLPSNLVWAITENKNGSLLIGTASGLVKLDQSLGEVKFKKIFSNELGLELNSEVNTLFKDNKNNIWLASDKLISLNQDEKTGKVYHSSPQSPDGLSNNTVKDIIQDRQDNIWFATNSGLNLFYPKKETFSHFFHKKDDVNSLSENSIKSLYEDREGRIWVGTRNAGLNLLDPKSGHITRFQHDPNKPKSLSNNFVLDIYQDKKGNIWVSTYGGGLNKLNVQTGEFEHFREKDGLPNDFVYGVLEDKIGRLWVATDRGLSRFNPQNNFFRNFDRSDGLPISEFNPNAIFQSTSTGKISLGGVNGFVTFIPENIQNNQYVPPIVLNSIKRFKANDPKAEPILDYWISSKKVIQLSHLDNIIEFDFAALNFKQPYRNKYKYKLEGFSNQWIDLGTNHNITFTNLDPGNYVLHIMGSNNDGVWNEVGHSLQIIILPPWYWNKWAWIIYLFFVGLFIYFIYQYQLNRQIALNETKRLKELDEAKTRLYTNITHEFRTPLTVISGTAEQEIEQKGEIAQDKNLFNAQMIKRNSDQLLKLVNQMLDLSKIESNHMKLNLINGDIIIFLKYIIESFQSYAASKDVFLKLDTELDHFFMDFDSDKILSVISNLLSNAIKFSQKDSEVLVEIMSPSGGALDITIKDEGLGISEEELPHIFDPFYQVESSSTRRNEGTGIGLALTKEMVNLMNGKISVSSVLGEGTIFSISLPVSSKAAKDNSLNPFLKSPQAILSNSGSGISGEDDGQNFAARSNLPLVLIIEDNRDVVQYLKNCLVGDYRLSVAFDGASGIEKAREIIPDIIISDVMMPNKDGFEVCKTLKSYEYTNHIPIILLTAKADLGSKLEGLETGADAYLPKPFHKKELLVRLKNLLDLRNQLQKHYLSLAAGKVTESQFASASKADDQYVQKVRSIIEAHLENSNFTVADLCQHMAISHSHFHRKIKALTGYSANQFIRFIRLSKAKEELVHTDKTIAEVAFETGFTDPVYFSRVFRKNYQITPSAYRQQTKNNKH